MKKTKLGIFSAAIASAAMAASLSANAKASMEKCMVVNKDGVGLIKEGKSQCGTKLHSCAGQNPAGEPDAWIMVPEGKCKAINMGHFEGVPKKTLDLIHTEKINKIHHDKDMGHIQHLKKKEQ